MIDNDGLRKDGEPDQRVGTGQFAYGKVDPSEAGREGGQATGGGNDDDDGGSGGQADGGKQQFAYGKVDPVEAGRKGGSSS